jgi:hypothetical protein
MFTDDTKGTLKGRGLLLWTCRRGGSLRTRPGHSPKRAPRLKLAVSGMTAFGTETLESCHSFGLNPKDLFRPASLVEIGPKSARAISRIGIPRSPDDARSEAGGRIPYSGSCQSYLAVNPASPSATPPAAAGTTTIHGGAFQIVRKNEPGEGNCEIVRRPQPAGPGCGSGSQCRAA